MSLLSARHPLDFGHIWTQFDTLCHTFSPNLDTPPALLDFIIDPYNRCLSACVKKSRFFPKIYNFLKNFRFIKNESD